MPRTCKYGQARNSTRCRANYKKKPCRTGYMRGPPEYLCKKSKIYVPLYVRNRNKSVKKERSPQSKLALATALNDAERERAAPVKANLKALAANTDAKRLQADLAKKRVDELLAKMKKRSTEAAVA